MQIGVYPPNAFRENEAIQKLYAEKRACQRSSILYQRQGDAWSVMECTQREADIDALIYELQKTAS
jgi:hypothetical protein